ncbi:hypothetical protein PLESTM_001604600 [Pleodorina starrii]|nr:hypothetical protein PLESTM_001604600 [Pleodorina starrii]
MPRRSNQGDAQTATLSPHFADLLVTRTSARTAAASPATAAWRPGGGGPRTAAAATSTSGSSPQSGGGSYVSRTAAATAARARQTSRQVAGQADASRLRPAASAGPVLSQARSVAQPATTPQRPNPSPAAGVAKRTNGAAAAAAAGPPLPSARSSPAALPAGARRLSAAAPAATGPRGQGVASPLQPTGSSGLARASPKALTYSEWLEAQSRSPVVQPQWRSPNDRTATAATAATATQRGPSPQAPGSAPGSRAPGMKGSATAVGVGGGAGVVPRTPPPIRPTISTSSGRADTDSAYSTPTAHSPAAISGPPGVARRPLLPPNSSASRELSFLEPGDSDISGGGSGGGGDGSGASGATGGFGSGESSDPNLGNEPSITTLTAGGRLRIAAQRDLPGGGGGGNGPDSPAGGSGRQLVFPGVAAVAAAVSSLRSWPGSAAAGGGAAGGGGGAAAAAAQGGTEPPGLSAPGAAGRGSFGFGAAGQLASEPSTEEDPGPQHGGAAASPPADSFEGYRGVRLHDYLRHHRRQQLLGEAYESGDTFVTGGYGTAVASARPSEYDISGTETVEPDGDSDSASVLLDDIVRQASVTGIMQMSPRGTLHRLSSRGGGSGFTALALAAATAGGLNSPSNLSNSAANFATGNSTAAIAAAIAAASVSATAAPPRLRPPRSMSARQPRSVSPQKARANSGSLQRAGEGDETTAGPGGASGQLQGSIPIPQAAAAAGPSQTSPAPEPFGLRKPQQKSPKPWEVQSFEVVRPAGAAAGDTGTGASPHGGGSEPSVMRGRGSGSGNGGSAAHGEPQALSVASSESRRGGAARQALTTHGSAPLRPAAPPALAKVRSFWLQMTSDWLSDGEDGSDRPTPTLGRAPRVPVTRSPGGRAGGVGGASAGEDAGSSWDTPPSAPTNPTQSPAAVAPRSLPPPPPQQQQPARAAEAEPHRGERVYAPKPPLPPGDFQSASQGGAAAAAAGAGSAAPAAPQRRQPPQKQRRWSIRDGNGGGDNDGRQGRSVSAPRASTTSMGSAASAGFGPTLPGPAHAPAHAPRPVSGSPWGGAAARPNSLTALARDLRDSVMRSPGGGGGGGARPAWAVSSRGSSYHLQPRGSHGTLNSPTSAASEAHGPVRGSISGASTFSALSGPQAGVMYNYPSHGYMERAVEYGRWEAAMLCDLDLYGSMQIPGIPSPDEYDDPSYLTRSTAGLPPPPPSGAAASPFTAAAARPATAAAGTAAGASPPGADPAGSAAPSRSHMPLRRTLSASSAMIAAAAANAVAQAGAGALAGAGPARGSALSSRLLMRSSRSWSPLRFSSTAAGGQSRITGDSTLEALDQILEEESSGRFSGAGPSEQATPDARTPDPSGGGGGTASSGSGSGSGSRGSAAPISALTHDGSFGSSPREPSLGAWPSFRRQSSYRRSGSSDGRWNFHVYGEAAPHGRRRESIGGPQERQPVGRQQLQPAAAPLPSPSPGVPYSPPAVRPAAAAAPPDAARPLVGPMRCISPPLLPTSEAEDAPQLPFPFSAAARGGNGSHLAYTNPLAAPAEAAESPRPALPQTFPRRSASLPRDPGNPYDSLSGGLEPPYGMAHPPSHAGASLPARGSRLNAGLPSPPPPLVPPTIPEEILSHPLTGLAGLSPHSSAASSIVAGFMQPPRRQDRQQQLQGRAPHGFEGGLESRWESECAALTSAPSGGGLSAGPQRHVYGADPSQLRHGADVAAGGASAEAITAAAVESAAITASPLESSPSGLEAQPYCFESAGLIAAPASGAALLAPNGSSGSSDDSSHHPVHLAAATMAADGAAGSARAAAAAAPGAAPGCRSSYAPLPAEQLLRTGSSTCPGIRTSQEFPQPQLHQHDTGGGPRGTGAERASLQTRHAPRGSGQELQTRGTGASAGYYAADPTTAPQYRPPSLESIQRLLDTDLPSPAIAAAVAVLAGSLPQSWARPLPPPPQGEQGWTQLYASQWADSAACVASLRSAGAERGVAVGVAASPQANVSAWGTHPDGAAGPGAGAGTGAPEAGMLYEGAGRSGAMSRSSYMALRTLAGERGMPPKPLQEEVAEPLAPAEAAATGGLLAGPAAGGRGAVADWAVGVDVAEADGVQSVVSRAGIGHILDGPLGRAVRLIAQSMLIVLAGAAGATAAASSANAVFMRPEDLPYEHGTSIYYTKYPRNKRLARTLYR